MAVSTPPGGGLLVEVSCSGELQCGTWPYDHLVYKTVFFRPKRKKH